jgi:hypothetical protein
MLPADRIQEGNCYRLTDNTGRKYIARVDKIAEPPPRHTDPPPKYLSSRSRLCASIGELTPPAPTGRRWSSSCSWGVSQAVP